MRWTFGNTVQYRPRHIKWFFKLWIWHSETLKPRSRENHSREIKKPRNQYTNNQETAKPNTTTPNKRKPINQETNTRFLFQLRESSAPPSNRLPPLHQQFAKDSYFFSVRIQIHFQDFSPLPTCLDLPRLAWLNCQRLIFSVRCRGTVALTCPAQLPATQFSGSLVVAYLPGLA